MILNLDGSPLRSGAKGNDFATLNDVQQHIVTVFGPLAQLLTEACDRIKILEDAAGIVAPNRDSDTSEVSQITTKHFADTDEGASIASSGDVE